MANELEYMGHEVNRIPRDIWKSFVDGGGHVPGVTDKLAADINIIAKWHHFINEDYINVLRFRSEAPVFYWVWDYMQGEEWHMKMVAAADLYIANDIYSGQYESDNLYYFPFDVSDHAIDKFMSAEKIYRVAFFGSWLGQGDRIEWMTEINKEYPITVFSPNHEEWKKRGFEAYPAVWGRDFSQRVAETKIILGFNVNDHSWGYWSNRVGKVLSTGGFLLQRYVPGMELFLRDGCDYFSSINEAKKKIAYYIEHNQKREEIAARGYEIGRDKFTSRARVRELSILMDRFKKGAFGGETLPETEG